MQPSGYNDWRQNIAIDVGQSQTVTLNPWVCPHGSEETCTAWITYPSDTNRSNDTDLVVVNPSVDIVTEIVSPRDSEEPGLVPVQVKLTNLGDEPAVVSYVQVLVWPSSYSDGRANIAIAAGESTVVLLDSWDYAGGTDTCTAYMTCHADTNKKNDIDVVIVNAGGVFDWVQMEPRAGMSLALLPSPLVGNVLQVEYSLNRVGPARVSLFDVSGRAVFTRGFTGSRRGEVPLDLRHVRGGVYLVRLDDGRSALTRKLVVQR